MKINPLVSVIIPTYNSASIISKAIDSALQQDYTNYEIIIVDDCSTDNTKQVVDCYCTKESKIVYFRLEQNLGPAAARNKGLENARGELIAFLDADDEWIPEKLSMQVELFARHPEMDLLFTEVEIMDLITGKTRLYSTINKIFQRQLSLIPDSKNPDLYKLEGSIKRELYLGNFICISSVLVRNKNLEIIKGFDNNRFGTEDLDIWVRLADLTQFYYWHKITAKYNWMSNSISRINDRRLEELLRYHKASLFSPDYRDMKDIIYRNLYLTYKLMIINYANHWKIMKAGITYIDSLHYPLKKDLWIYTMASILGPLPLKIKNQLINPFGFKRRNTSK